MSDESGKSATGAGFELLDHPADMGLRVWAGSQEELFSTAGLALTSVLFDTNEIEARTGCEIEVAGSDLELLLYNWLSELLFLFDAEATIFREIDVVSITSDAGNLHLKARAKGEEYESERHSLKTYVKAVTLHQLQIRAGENGYEAVIYLDI
ncbi:MAG: archease [Cyanobacteria bacterium HKST-UBA02]|nr:archease [Cyanobacteria bacterium HKST-UBA02]